MRDEAYVRYEIGGTIRRQDFVQLCELLRNQGFVDFHGYPHTADSSPELHHGRFFAAHDQLRDGSSDELEGLLGSLGLSFYRYCDEIYDDPPFVAIVLGHTPQARMTIRHTILEEPAIRLCDIEAFGLRSIRDIRAWLTLPEIPPFVITEQ